MTSPAAEQLAGAADPVLVALDVDGTLVTHQDVMSPAVAQAICALDAAGHHVVLSTGRSVLATLDVAARAGLDQVWGVVSNGAVTVRFDEQAPAGWRTVDQVTFDATSVIELLAAELPDAMIAVEDVGHGFRLNRPFPPGELTGRQTVVGLAELVADPVTRAVVRSPDHTPDDFHELVSRLGLDDVTYAIGWTAWMDIAPAGVTKASALEAVRRELGVPPERTVAIGDGHNDIDMLRWAARGVAMGHADAAVRAAADEVTASIEQDGALPLLHEVLSGDGVPKGDGVLQRY